MCKLQFIGNSNESIEMKTIDSVAKNINIMTVAPLFTNATLSKIKLNNNKAMNARNKPQLSLLEPKSQLLIGK